MRQKRQVYTPEFIFNLLCIGNNVDIETSLCESIGLPEIFATHSPLYGGILPNNTQFHCQTRTPLLNEWDLPALCLPWACPAPAIPLSINYARQPYPAQVLPHWAQVLPHWAQVLPQLLAQV